MATELWVLSAATGQGQGQWGPSGPVRRHRDTELSRQSQPSWGQRSSLNIPQGQRALPCRRPAPGWPQCLQEFQEFVRKARPDSELGRSPGGGGGGGRRQPLLRLRSHRLHGHSNPALRAPPRQPAAVPPPPALRPDLTSILPAQSWQSSVLPQRRPEGDPCRMGSPALGPVCPTIYLEMRFPVSTAWH